MRIRSSEIEIILEDIYSQKAATTSLSDFVELIKLQDDWENRWLEVVELEENESLLDWMENW